MDDVADDQRRVMLLADGWRRSRAECELGSPVCGLIEQQAAR